MKTNKINEDLMITAVPQAYRTIGPDVCDNSWVRIPAACLCFKIYSWDLEDGGNIGGSRIHFPSVPGKYLADLRSRANSQQYSSIYED